MMLRILPTKTQKNVLRIPLFMKGDMHNFSFSHIIHLPNRMNRSSIELIGFIYPLYIEISMVKEQVTMWKGECACKVPNSHNSYKDLVEEKCTKH
jgi:hypothetical protein